MSTKVHTKLPGTEVDFTLSGPWTGYWIAFLRLMTGYWFFHAGLTKFLESGGFSAEGYLLYATKGTIVGPITVWFGNNAVWFADIMIPLGELLIGLGLMVGALTRLAAFFGAFLMFFFYFGNQSWSHGFVSSDMMGLLLFGTVIVFGAGRVWGLDQYIEQTDVVQNNRWMRYFLG